MRELTKSMTRFSWAMSLFGARQMLNLLDPARASRAFESVTRAAEGELDDSLRSTFRMGDRLQRSMVDATFSVLGVGGLDPAAWTDSVEETLDRATDVVRRAAKIVSPGCGTDTEPHH